MALGDGGDQPVDLARQFSAPTLQASTPCIGIGCQAPSFLLIGLDVMGNYVGGRNSAARPVRTAVSTVSR